MSSIFVEEVENPVVTNTMFRLASLIMRAEKLTCLVTLYKDDLEFRSSKVTSLYFENSKLISANQVSKLIIARSLFVAFFYTLFLPINRSILRKKYRGAAIGPTVYDAYLAKYKSPTYRNFDIQVFRLFYQVIQSVDMYRYFFRQNEVSCVLTSHRVGIRGSSISIAASLLNIPIYSFGGDSNIALIKSREPFGYEYKALDVDMTALREIDIEDLEEYFEITRKEHLNHEIIMDSKYAFEGKIWKSKLDFATAYPTINLSKPVVFVLPHVYTDYPNTLFSNSEYVDYLDWFKDTIKSIYKNQNINWVIREHPSSRFYGLHGSDLSYLKTKFDSPNILWISADDDFSSESIGVLADAVITYIGSAGFEYPAMYSVPSIYWNHAPYSGFGIGEVIDSRTTYHKLISCLHKTISELNLNTFEAKRQYLFANKISRFPYPLAPQMTQADYIQKNENPYEYIQDALKYYNENIETIEVVEKEILRQLEDLNFKGLRRELSRQSPK